MKSFLVCLICSFFSILNAASSQDIESFLSTYSGPAYQDLIIQNKCFRKGTDICQVRYEMISSVLDLYQGPFSVLDLGAAQGYFSFKIAENYPQSKCVMIGANTNYYGNHGDMLHDLCQLNDHLKNITYLNKCIDLGDLNFLNQRQHFDVILALLVIHQIDESLSKRIAVIESLLKLGDHVIIEVSNDVAPDLGGYVESLSKKIDCIYLGEVRRHYNFDSKATGKLFCFKKSQSNSINSHLRMDVHPETFSRLNGVYP